jgi:hypothetical protein
MARAALLADAAPLRDRCSVRRLDFFDFLPFFDVRLPDRLLGGSSVEAAPLAALLASTPASCATPIIAGGGALRAALRSRLASRLRSLRARFSSRLAAFRAALASLRACFSIALRALRSARASPVGSKVLVVVVDWFSTGQRVKNMFDFFL